MNPTINHRDRPTPEEEKERKPIYDHNKKRPNNGRQKYRWRFSQSFGEIIRAKMIIRFRVTGSVAVHGVRTNASLFGPTTLYGGQFERYLLRLVTGRRNPLSPDTWRRPQFLSYDLISPAGTGIHSRTTSIHSRKYRNSEVV